MTDRIDQLTVALEKEYRDDDVQIIVKAIEMIKGVAKVTHLPVDNHWSARVAVRHDLAKKLWKVLSEDD